MFSADIVFRVYERSVSMVFKSKLICGFAARRLSLESSPPTQRVFQNARKLKPNVKCLLQGLLFINATDLCVILAKRASSWALLQGFSAF